MPVRHEVLTLEAPTDAVAAWQSGTLDRCGLLATATLTQDRLGWPARQVDAGCEGGASAELGCGASAAPR